MVNLSHGQSGTDRRRQATIMVLVALLHFFMLYWFAMMRGTIPAPELTVPAIDVTLFDLAGGGGTSAGDSESAADLARSSAPPSAIHAPPDPIVWPEQLQAPLVSAPQELTGTAGTTVVMAPISTVSEEAEQFVADAPMGSVGQGGGTGGGAGDGNGPGQGSGSGPGIGRGRGVALIRGPTGATITQNVSAESLDGMTGGYGVLRCVIMLDQRLDNCRVLREHPAGSGMGQAALAKSREFRFRPPYRSGRFSSNHRITVAIAFPPPVETVETRP